MRKATLILLAGNRWDLTERCLASLRRTDLAECEVMVVDNGSGDETPRRLADVPGARDRVRVVTLPRNLGFAHGTNAGIAVADPASDIVLLDHGIELPQRDWLAGLRAEAEKPGVGIAGCRLIDREGRLRHAGTYILPDTL